MKVNYAIHHQAVATCPECKYMIIEDLGEFDNADGIVIDCPQCKCDIEFEGKID